MKSAQLVSEGSLGTKMILAVASSYVIDGILLAGFALAGTVTPTIPLAYTAIGLIDTSVILLLRAWSSKYRRDTSDYALARAPFSWYSPHWCRKWRFTSSPCCSSCSAAPA